MSALELLTLCLVVLMLCGVMLSLAPVLRRVGGRLSAAGTVVAAGSVFALQLTRVQPEAGMDRTLLVLTFLAFLAVSLIFVLRLRSGEFR